MVWFDHVYGAIDVWHRNKRKHISLKFAFLFLVHLAPHTYSRSVHSLLQVKWRINGFTVKQTMCRAENVAQSDNNRTFALSFSTCERICCGKMHKCKQPGWVGVATCDATHLRSFTDHSSPANVAAECAHSHQVVSACRPITWSTRRIRRCVSTKSKFMTFSNSFFNILNSLFLPICLYLLLRRRFGFETRTRQCPTQHCAFSPSTVRNLRFLVKENENAGVRIR